MRSDTYLHDQVQQFAETAERSAAAWARMGEVVRLAVDAWTQFVEFTEARRLGGQLLARHRQRRHR